MHNVMEGTWEELSIHAGSFGGKRLRLTIVDADTVTPAYQTESARIAAIRAGIGKFADPTRTTLASDDLRYERQCDEMKYNQSDEGKVK